MIYLKTDLQMVDFNHLSISGYCLYIFLINIGRLPKVGLEREQDIEQLKSTARELGQFPIYDVKNGIEVRGYEK